MCLTQKEGKEGGRERKKNEKEGGVRKREENRGERGRERRGRERERRGRERDGERALNCFIKHNTSSSPIPDQCSTPFPHFR